MTPRRVQAMMVVVFGAATVGLIASGLVVGAVITGALAVAQLLAVVLAPRMSTQAVIVFTDIVGSTAIVEEIGDAAWQRRFDQYLQIARPLLYRVSAAAVKDLGDGVLAAFPVPGATPGRVLATALQLSEAAAQAGLPTRTGAHFGRCSVSKRDARGLVVHVAARVMQTAGAGQVVVTGSVRDVVEDDGLVFHELGEQPLRGVSGPVSTYSVRRSATDGGGREVASTR